MARETTEIHQGIIGEIENTPELAPLANNKKKTARWRLFGFIVAKSQSITEKSFDLHTQEVEDIISNMKPHNPLWYANKVKAFQYGKSLVYEADYYDNSGMTEEEIEAQKIVKHVAVEELEEWMRIKVVKEVNGERVKLEDHEMDALKEYMKRVKDGGVRLRIDSLDADSLKLEIDIYYNPLVLDANGRRIDGTNDAPCNDALELYLDSLKFNGLFVPTFLIDGLQKVEGVDIPVIKVAQAKYGELPFTDIGVKYKPDAGYLKFYDVGDLKFNFKANV